VWNIEDVNKGDRQMKLIVFEKVNIDAMSEAIFASEKPLRETKRLASRRQAFRDSTMVIETESGTMVAFKKPGERWTDVDD